MQIFEEGTVRANDLPEFKGQIVDIFEDFLDEHNYDFANDERQSAIDDGDYEDPSEAAHIWGDDYDYIADVVEEITHEHTRNEITKNDITHIMNAFEELCAQNNIDLSDENKSSLTGKIETTFTNWNISIT